MQEGEEIKIRSKIRRGTQKPEMPPNVNPLSPPLDTKPITFIVRKNAKSHL
jgi:hypothetical protein